MRPEGPKNVFVRTPPPLCQGLDGRPPPTTPLSEGLDPPLGCFCEDAPRPLYVRAWMVAHTHTKLQKLYLVAIKTPWGEQNLLVQIYS